MTYNNLSVKVDDKINLPLVKRVSMTDETGRILSSIYIDDNEMIDIPLYIKPDCPEEEIYLSFHVNKSNTKIG